MNVISMLFGGRNAIKETLEVFRPNAEASDVRASTMDSEALSQLAAEFHQRQNRNWFDTLVDGLNRLPRPMMVLAVFGVLVWTAVDPLRMAEVFTAWAIIPAGFWAIIGVIVSFFFGGRVQLKNHDFQREFAATLAAAPEVINSLRQVRSLRDDEPPENAAIADWQARNAAHNGA